MEIFIFTRGTTRNNFMFIVHIVTEIECFDSRDEIITLDVLEHTTRLKKWVKRGIIGIHSEKYSENIMSP